MRQTRDQVRALVDQLREAVGRPDAPVLIDQEGGRVARLRPPEWRAYPAAAEIAALPGPVALEAARLGARLIADDLAELGITVDATPVSTCRRPAPIRSSATAPGAPIRPASPRSAARSVRVCWPAACCRSSSISRTRTRRVDSHKALPRVDDERAALVQADFAPFRALADMPWAMTAHIVYTAIDDAAPATLSRS